MDCLEGMKKLSGISELQAIGRNFCVSEEVDDFESVDEENEKNEAPANSTLKRKGMEDEERRASTTLEKRFFLFHLVLTSLQELGKDAI
jgi:hypothetical protein